MTHRRKFAISGDELLFLLLPLIQSFHARMSSLLALAVLPMVSRQAPEILYLAGYEALQYGRSRLRLPGGSATLKRLGWVEIQDGTGSWDALSDTPYHCRLSRGVYRLAKTSGGARESQTEEAKTNSHLQRLNAARITLHKPASAGLQPFRWRAADAGDHESSGGAPKQIWKSALGGASKRTSVQRETLRLHGNSRSLP